MINVLRVFTKKYLEEFKDIFEYPYNSIIEQIEKIIYYYWAEKLSIEEAIQKLQIITGDNEYTPFKWILHHIRIDLKNHILVSEIKRNSPNAIVYKYFEHRDYGFNLLSAIYEKEIKRLSHIEKRAKLFRLSTLFENERRSLGSIQYLPKISSTFFKDHKYNYSIYDWGILTTYHERERWDRNLQRYRILENLGENISSISSFSFTKEKEKFKVVHNIDGSRTIVDNYGNTETYLKNGWIETKLKIGKTIIEYPDGAIDIIDECGLIKSTDFEGNLILK